MKYIHDWNDLRAYGINYLTGEACAVGKRLLCDVNERGRAVVLFDLRSAAGHGVC